MHDPQIEDNDDIRNFIIKGPSCLSFNALRAANVVRCVESFHPIDQWTETDWACALAGEVGELCNLVKKRRRGEDVTPEELMKEAADVVIYADLVAAKYRRSLGEAVCLKFDEVSERRKSKVKIANYLDVR